MGTLPDGSKIEEFSMTQFSMFLTDFFLGYFTKTDDFHQLDFEISSNIFNPRIHIQRDFHGVNCHPLGLTLRGWWLRESLAVRQGISDKQLTGWRLVDVGGLYTGLSYHPIEFCIYIYIYIYTEFSEAFDNPLRNFLLMDSMWDRKEIFCPCSCIPTKRAVPGLKVRCCTLKKTAEGFVCHREHEEYVVEGSIQGF